MLFVIVNRLGELALSRSWRCAEEAWLVVDILRDTRNRGAPFTVELRESPVDRLPQIEEVS